nr:hypothetical protein [Tanacetum cinerariifolium]
MSTQQDIYAAGSKIRPPMLNKENYVSWSSRLYRYAKTRPNKKLIYNSIMNGPYLRRMIPEPGDADRKGPVSETFHEQIDEELTEKELKQVEADDQSIQTILLGLPKEIYAAVDSCEMLKKFGYNVGNQNGLIVVPKITNRNVNQNANGNVVSTRGEGNGNGNNKNQIRCYNYKGFGHLARNYIQASTSGSQTDRAPVYDSDVSAEVSKQKDTTKGTSVNTQFCEQSILGKPPSSSRTKLYSVTHFPKSMGLPKVDETHALSKPVTSNSVPKPQESNVMKNEKVITPGLFRIDPFKTSREDKFMPINKVRASTSHTKTRRPQPRSNTKNDRVPSASKSSRIKNKKVKVEEHYRNLLLSKNKKHMSSECNNVKLAIWNDKSKVVCVMCKKCLITANHDVCVLNYVNDMNSRGKKQNPKVMKPKKVGSNEGLASPKPSKTRSYLRWSPTGRIFNLKGKTIQSSES